MDHPPLARLHARCASDPELRQLLTQAALAEEQAIAIGKLAAGVAHELNNVLAAILGNAELLRDDLLAANADRELVASAEEILAVTDRSGTLIGGLLRYARDAADTPETIGAADLLRRSHQLLSRSLGSRIRVDLDMPDDLGLTTLVARRFETALTQLVLNARDALDGAGTITLRGRLLDAPGAESDRVEIAVVDGGVGMTPEVCERCAEPFFTTRPGAAGLGLTVAERFARDSRGRLAIRSAPGEGTTVALRIPLSEDGADRP